MKKGKGNTVISLVLSVAVVFLSVSAFAKESIYALDESDTDGSIVCENSDGDCFISLHDLSPPGTQKAEDTEDTAIYPTYKVESADDGEYIPLLKHPDDNAQISGKILSGTYHMIKHTQGDFGYISYKENSGWIRLKHTTRVNNPLGESLVQSLNSAYELYREQLAYETMNIDEFESLKESFDLLEQLCINSQSVDEFLSAKSQLDKSVTEFKNVLEFVENPQGSQREHFRFYGDVNADGKVNMLDVTTLQRYIARLCPFDDVAYFASDVNEDDEVSMNDVVTIQLYLCELLEVVPAGLLFHL